MRSDYLVIGEVLKPQGVRGELKVRPLTCDPDRFQDLAFVYRKKGDAFVSQAVSFHRRSNEGVYLSLDGVHTRDDAEKLRGELLYVDRAHAVQLSENANFICDLIGCEGFDDEGQSYGTLTDVLQPGANDVYVFTKGTITTLVPALISVILSVDTGKGRIEMSAQRLRETAVVDEI